MAQGISSTLSGFLDPESRLPAPKPPLFRFDSLAQARELFREKSVAGYFASGTGCIAEVGPTLCIAFAFAGAILHRSILATHAHPYSWHIAPSDRFPVALILITSLLLVYRYLKKQESGNENLGCGCLLTPASTLGVSYWYYKASEGLIGSAMPALPLVLLGNTVMGMILWVPSIVVVFSLAWLLRTVFSLARTAGLLMLIASSRVFGKGVYLQAVSLMSIAIRGAHVGLSTLLGKLIRPKFVVLAAFMSTTLVLTYKNQWELLSSVRATQVWILFAFIAVGLLFMTSVLADQTAKTIWREGREYVRSTFGKQASEKTPALFSSTIADDDLVKTTEKGGIPSFLSFLPTSWSHVEIVSGVEYETIPFFFNFIEHTIGQKLLQVFRVQFVFRTVSAVVVTLLLLVGFTTILTMSTTGVEYYKVVTKLTPGSPLPFDVIGFHFDVYLEVIRIQFLSACMMSLFVVCALVSHYLRIQRSS